jgi:cytoplasmic iron level regulating protein YaaA (DUF328/UPF0246 family)
MMKTISLEVDEQIYSNIINFLRLLPSERCRLIEDDDTLTPAEIAHLQAIRTQLRQHGDDEFDDWAEIKGQL